MFFILHWPDFRRYFIFFGKWQSGSKELPCHNNGREKPGMKSARVFAPCEIKSFSSFEADVKCPSSFQALLWNTASLLSSSTAGEHCRTCHRFVATCTAVSHKIKAVDEKSEGSVSSCSILSLCPSVHPLILSFSAAYPWFTKQQPKGGFSDFLLQLFLLGFLFLHLCQVGRF